MNIGQIARSQQMLYKISNKNVSSSYSPESAVSSSSKISAYNGLLNGWGTGSAKDDGDNFFSSPAAVKGTVRQIAQRLYDASFSPDAAADKYGVNFSQGINSLGGDPTLEALRKQLGTKVESLQQRYQPDKTALSDLQAVADSLVSRLQTVNLSDETTKKIQELALMDAKNSAGAQEDGKTGSVLSQTERLDMIRDEVQKFAPSKRAAAFNTINKVWNNEMDRIGEYIKEKDPNWTMWGDKFDASILNDYKAGINMWV